MKKRNIPEERGFRWGEEGESVD